jgi:hypothetical protein
MHGALKVCITRDAAARMMDRQNSFDNPSVGFFVQE